MVLYQTNFILHSGHHSSSNFVSLSLSLSVSIILRILCIHLHFLATLSRMTNRRSLRIFYESDIISKNTFFFSFWGVFNFNSVPASLFVDLNAHLDCYHHLSFFREVWFWGKDRKILTTLAVFTGGDRGYLDYWDMTANSFVEIYWKSKDRAVM